MIVALVASCGGAKPSAAPERVNAFETASMGILCPTASAAGDGWVGTVGADSCGGALGRCLSVIAVEAAAAPPTTAETATTSVAMGLMVTTAGGRGTVGGPFGNRWG